MDREQAKQLAAAAALELLPEGGVIGLGSGSTAQLFIDGVGRLVREGRRLTGVPTSEASRAQAERLGIPLLSDEGPFGIDLCVDGADEVSDALDLIKGGGACHTREKIVNQASRMNVIIVDESKLSRLLGEKWPIPVEVLKFGHRSTSAELARHGRVELRKRGGSPVLTDSGNLIYDLHAGILDDPGQLDVAVRRIPGVVETGLFVKRASLVLVASEAGVRRIPKAG